MAREMAVRRHVNNGTPAPTTDAGSRQDDCRSLASSYYEYSPVPRACSLLGLGVSSAGACACTCACKDPYASTPSRHNACDDQEARDSNGGGVQSGRGDGAAADPCAGPGTFSSGGGDNEVAGNMYFNSYSLPSSPLSHSALSARGNNRMPFHIRQATGDAINQPVSDFTIGRTVDHSTVQCGLARCQSDVPTQPVPHATQRPRRHARTLSDVARVGLGPGAVAAAAARAATVRAASAAAFLTDPPLSQLRSVIHLFHMQVMPEQEQEQEEVGAPVTDPDDHDDHDGDDDDDLDRSNAEQ